MSDNRPVELNSWLQAETDKNDVLIIQALEKLEDPVKRGKLRVTVASICVLTGLSRNTVRNREWALDRLKAIKLGLRSAKQDSSAGEEGPVGDGAILEKLRKRIKALLDQNALLYEEILSLHHVVANKDRVIETLKARKLASVTSLPRRIETHNPDMHK